MRPTHDVEADLDVPDHRRVSTASLCVSVVAALSLAFGAGLLPFGVAHLHKPNADVTSEFDRLLHEVLAELPLVAPPLHTLRASSCDALRGRLQQPHYVQSGWTKAVFSASLLGRQVALKVPDFTGTDMKRCLAYSGSSTHNAIAFQVCYRLSLKKMLKELVLLTVMAHSSVVKVLHFCADDQLDIPAARDSVEDDRLVLLEQAPLIVVTEYGSPLEPIRLLQLKWEDRLRVAQNIGQLLVHFANNELRTSALISDFRATQFVLADDGSLQLTDLDDVSIVEPLCTVNSDCSRASWTGTGTGTDDVGVDDDKQEVLQNTSTSVQCVHRVCRGYNENRNLAYALAQLENLILPHGAPPMMQQAIEHLLSGLKAGRIESAVRLSDELNEIIANWTNGVYLEQPRPKTLDAYNSVDNVTAGLDYRCRYVLNDIRCLLSVFDMHEAASLCNSDEHCEGYVVMPQRNWSGRQMVSLRNQIRLDGTTHAAGSRLFVKL